MCCMFVCKAHWQVISFHLSVYPDGNSSHMLFKVVCLRVSDLMFKCSCSLCWQCTVKAASVLHDRLFRRLLLSPMRFFDTTPLGRILTRFSRDMDEGEAWFVLTRNLSPLEDFSVSEVTLVDKGDCWVHSLREWLSVIHFTVVFIWLVDASMFLPYLIRPIRYILHLLSSWCAPHHANRDAASEPDPCAILLGDGGHRLSLVSDHHPATGGVSLPHQTCLQVRLPSLHYVHDDKHRAWNLSRLFALYISSPYCVGNMITEHMCSSYPKSKVA